MANGDRGTSPASGAPSPPATPREILDSLPPTLPEERVRAANPPRTDSGTPRTYTYNGWTFDLPPGVFSPGGTSRVIHDRLLSGEIGVTGRVYVVMGAGLGIEAIIAGRAGARAVYAVDSHEPSVTATASHYRELVDSTATGFVPLVSDLFERFPSGVAADLITFNPPAVAYEVADDPDTVRNTCVGPGIVTRFLDQVAEYGVLAPGGEIFVVLSNTSDPRAVVSHAIETGYVPEIAYVQTYAADTFRDVRTYLFRFTRETAGTDAAPRACGAP